MKSVSVVIPTYNGRGLLEKNLPPLKRAAALHGGGVEIIVVDDASGDDTVPFLRENHPDVRLLVNETNRGFAATMNRGIDAARHDLVLALNSDILVDDDLFVHAPGRFSDADLFSVTPSIIDPRSGQNQAITRLTPGACWFGTRFLQLGDLPRTDGEIPLFFASGGATFYDREKLRLLEGFDVIYHPFYVEDMDLSYRGWKAGWRVVLEPRTTVYHETSSTILNIHRKRKIKFIGDRNRTLLLWLNVTDPLLILRYVLCLPFSFLRDVVQFRKYKFIGFFWALAYLPRVLDLRRKRRALFCRPDRDIIKLVS